MSRIRGIATKIDGLTSAADLTNINQQTTNRYKIRQMPVKSLIFLKYSNLEAGHRQCLPTMPCQAVNIAFSGLRSGYFKHFLDRRYHNTVINILEGREVHCAVLLHQPPFAFSDLSVVQKRHFFLNSGDANAGKSIENSLFNGRTGYLTDCRNTWGNPEPVHQFADKLTGFNNIFGKWYRIAANIFNGYCYRPAAAFLNDIVVNVLRWYVNCPYHSPTG